MEVPVAVAEVAVSVTLLVGARTVVDVLGGAGRGGSPDEALVIVACADL